MKINTKNLYFLDTETGGLKSYVNGICSLYIRAYEGIFEHRFFFRPQNKIYDFASFEVNKLNFEELKKGVSRGDFISMFTELMNTHKNTGYITICGWNSAFDLDFISQIYKDKGEKLSLPILNLDLLEIYRKNVPKKDLRKKESEGVEDYKLTTIYKYFFTNYQEEFAHTDVYDVHMVQELFVLAFHNKWIDLE